MVYMKSRPQQDEEDLQGQPGGVNVVRSPLPQASGQAPAPTASKEGSGFFTNLSKYIDANKGRSEQFAGDVVAGQEKTIQEAQNPFQQEVGQYQAAESAKSLQPVWNAGSQEKLENIGTWDKGSADWANLRNLISGGTPISTDFQASGESLAGLEAAKQRAQGLDTSAGKSLALSDYYKSKGTNVTGGEQTFNNLLMNRDVNAPTLFANLKEKVFNPETGVSASAKALETSAEEQAKKTAAANRALSEQAGQAVTNLYGKETTDVAGKIAAQNALKTKEYEDLKKSLAKEWAGVGAVDPYSWTKSQDVVNTEGFGGLAGQAITQKDIEALLKPAAASTWQTVMTPEQQAKINALAELGGKEQYTGQLSGAPSYTFDQAAYDAKVKAIEDQVAAANKARKDALDRVAAAKEANKKFQESVANSEVGSVSDLAKKMEDAFNPQKSLSVEGAKTTVEDIADKGGQVWDTTTKQPFDVLTKQPLAAGWEMGTKQPLEAGKQAATDLTKSINKLIAGQGSAPKSMAGDPYYMPTQAPEAVAGSTPTPGAVAPVAAKPAGITAPGSIATPAPAPMDEINRITQAAQQQAADIAKKKTISELKANIQNTKNVLTRVRQLIKAAVQLRQQYPDLTYDEALKMLNT